MKTILVSAYGCEPLKGSESCVGWNWVLQLAENFHVHVITRSNNRDVIEQYVPSLLSSRITFHYYDTNSWLRKLKNGEKRLYFYYFCWQLGIIPLIKKLERQYHFDYSMHLTFGSVWLPTFLPCFKIPFIWGPLGGGEFVPRSFLPSLSLPQRVLQSSRYFFKATRLLNPFFLFCSCRAVSILCRTNYTSNLFLKYWGNKVKLISDGGIEPEIFQYQADYRDDNIRTIQLLLTSRFVDFKNIRTAILAMKHVPFSYNIHLNIVGEGPERSRLVRMVDHLDLKSRVTIGALVSREEIFTMLAESDIYLFPSLREACNLSLLEAMAVGLPVICLNWSGMALSTDQNSAIQLPVSNPTQMSRDMAAAICRLIDSSQLRRKIGMSARKRVKEYFSWSRKSEFMKELIDDLESDVNRAKNG